MKALTVTCNGQKSYGRDINVGSVYDYFIAKLDGRFPFDQVMHAFDVYTDRQNDIPAPADLIKIMDPPKPQITEAEYIQALKVQEKMGYPMHSVEAFTIKKYQEQKIAAQRIYNEARRAISGENHAAIGSSRA